MTSEVEICNAALIKIGNENTISALGEDGREGETCDLMYPIVRDALLQSHLWNFAMARKTLSEDGSTPAFEYTNAFQLPGDYLRAVSLYDTDERWKVEGDLLLTDASTAKLIYIKKVTNTGNFTALFVKALVLSLAVDLSEVINTSTSKKQTLQAELKAVMREAKRRDGQEGTPDNIQANAFIKGIKSSNQWWDKR